MKYIAKEECYFDTGTEVEIIRQVYDNLYWCKGKLSVYFFGIKEPEVQECFGLCSIDELYVLKGANEMSSVNREVLVERISNALPSVTKKDVTAVVRQVFNTITDAVVNNEVVTVTGFGKFTPRVRGARKGRNLQTGESMDIGPKTVVSFKAGSSLKHSLNSSTG